MKEKSTTEVNKKQTKRIRNFLLLILLFITFGGLVIYCCKLYKVNEEEKMKTPIINGMLSEIYSDDLEHYILDNPTTIIYMCAANDYKCRTFEKSFKKLLHKKNYEDRIIYLNLTDVDQEKFVSEFNNKYNYRVHVSTNYPAFVLFEDGKVKSILQGKDGKTLSIEKVKQFIELNEIGE